MHARILIVGHSPGRVVEGKSITSNRVKTWMNSIGIESYEWTNLVHYHTPSLKMSEVTLKPTLVRQYDHVIALGRDAAKWLRNNGLQHLEVPHPSGLNRIWNNPGMEREVVCKIKEYLR
jgi:uracil-DNA glycosylase